MAYDPDQRRRALKRFMAERNIKLKPWCDLAKVSRGAVHNFMAKRSRTLTDETYQLLADAAGVSAEILRGQRPPPAHIQVVGYVGAGAEVFPVDDHEKGGGIDEVSAPPGIGANAVAVRVRGDSMFPAYRDQDILFYQRDGLDDWHRYLGRDVIVKLVDGRTLVKMLKRATKTTAILGSHNAPDIEGAAVDWASPVSWVMRAGA